MRCKCFGYCSCSYSWLCPQVAIAFTKRDPIRTHARDELGIDVDELANPLQVLPVPTRGFLGLIQNPWLLDMWFWLIACMCMSCPCR